jgi:hypothetical protein
MLHYPLNSEFKNHGGALIFLINSGETIVNAQVSVSMAKPLACTARG